MESYPNLFYNPFLDPTVEIKGGLMSVPGKGLTQIETPNFQTLIQISSGTKSPLPLIPLQSSMGQENLIGQEILVRQTSPILQIQQTPSSEYEKIGIELDLFKTSKPEGSSVPPISSGYPSIKLSSSEILSGQITPTGQGTLVSQEIPIKLPTNYDEALAVLSMITSHRTSGKSKSFGVSQLRQIAKNLNLHAAGNKETLANRIREAVENYYNLKK